MAITSDDLMLRKVVPILFWTLWRLNVCIFLFFLRIVHKHWKLRVSEFRKVHEVPYENVGTLNFLNAYRYVFINIGPTIRTSLNIKTLKKNV